MKREKYIQRIIESKENEMIQIPICLTQKEVKFVYDSIVNRQDESPVVTSHQNIYKHSQETK